MQIKIHLLPAPKPDKLIMQTATSNRYIFISYQMYLDKGVGPHIIRVVITTISAFFCRQGDALVLFLIY